MSAFADGSGHGGVPRGSAINPPATTADPAPVRDFDPQAMAAVQSAQADFVML
jgi:hypothetical protein